MKRMLAGALAAVLCLAASLTAASSAPPQAGDKFPDLRFAPPTQAGEAGCLSLATWTTSFDLTQVQTSYVLLEIFSMYCTFCHVAAPQVNQLYYLFKQQKLKGALKMMGVGVGDSDCEVGVFRKQYKAPFPLLVDPDFNAHQALSQPRTPLYILLKLKTGGEPQIPFTHLGPIGQPQEFPATLKQKASLT